MGMSTAEVPARTSSPEEKELSIISQGAQALAELSLRIAPRFGRVEVRSRVERYLHGLLASVERKNGWQLAEELGDPNVHGVQRLMAEADWDEEAVRDDLRAYVIEHLGEAGGVLVVDETGKVREREEIGRGSAAVQRDSRPPGEQPGGGLSPVCQFQGVCLHRSRALPVAGLDRGSRALPRGRHSRRGRVCHQRRAGPADVG